MFELVLEYEGEFFGDFTFQSDSIVAPFLEYKIEEDGEEVTKHVEFYEFASITNSYYRFLVKDLDERTEGTADHSLYYTSF